jgi:alcohol dehydrogenase class IV
MSRPIGAHFHVPHGLSNALLLPDVTEFSVGAATPRYAALARSMGLAERAHSDDAACERLVDGLRALNADLAVPRLSQLGVERGHFDAVKEDMAEAALASGSPGFNPRVPSAEEIVALYDEAW